MEIHEPIHLLTATAASAVLVAAALFDIKARRIPNWAVLTILTLFAVSTAVSGGAGLLSGLGAAAIAFVVTYGLYAFGIVGAGDAKLFSAVALFAGLSNLAAFSLATVLAGGLIAAAILAAQPRHVLALIQTRNFKHQGRGVPYGVAIAAGGLLTLWGAADNLIGLVG
ncbi:MAG: prepilin peptidase [Caulobacterales bacterium]